MSDLIERNDALKTVNAEFQAFRNYECYANTHKAIQAIPAVKINSATDNVAINLLIGIRKFDNISEAAKAALDKAIEALSIPAAFRWISVEDALPEKDKSYITYAETTKYCNHNELPEESRINILYFNGEEWYDEECIYYNVTHWMPLPEPPKNEE